jgi:hypothetical protein
LYEAIKNDPQGSGMATSKKWRVSSKLLISKNRLPSDFSVEVEGFDVEVVKHFT